jgi:hypothetical protein
MQRLLGIIVNKAAWIYIQDDLDDHAATDRASKHAQSYIMHLPRRHHPARIYIYIYIYTCMHPSMIHGGVVRVLSC